MALRVQQKKMNTQQLLIPRVRCVSQNGGYHYPDSPFGPNEILHLRTDLFQFPAYCDDDGNQPNFISESEAKKYPNLFQEVKWWEERSLNDISCVNYLKYMSLSRKKYIYFEVVSFTVGYHFGKDDQLLANECHCINDGYYEIATQEEWDMAVVAHDVRRIRIQA